jgi:hypothetical protein
VGRRYRHKAPKKEESKAQGPNPNRIPLQQRVKEFLEPLLANHRGDRLVLAENKIKKARLVQIAETLYANEATKLPEEELGRGLGTQYFVLGEGGCLEGGVLTEQQS